MNNRQAFSQVVKLIGLILVLVSCTQAPSPQAAKTPTVGSSTLTPTAIATLLPTPTGSATGIEASAENVGPVPQDCPPGPAPREVDPSEFGPGVGGFPVWGIGFEGPHATVHLNGLLSGVYGWGVKVLWAVGPHYTSTVTLHGGNLRTGSPLWLGGGDGLALSLVLDPLHPGTITGSDHGWAEFPGGMDVPQAGCYYLEAHWPGGSWRITFAAGL